jgi:bidirectional [NiFe] hydrogenase diaphorase subunit
MKQVTIFIDNQEISAPEGEKLLWVALDNGFYIPNLCALREKDTPHASCRLCFVEVAGHPRPVASCTLPVTEGMTVTTRSPRVDRLVKTAFELLLSDHRLGCAKCPANSKCELQKIARERGLKLKQKHFPYLEKEAYVDESTGVFGFDSSRCVLCGRCVWIDRQVAKVGALGFSWRGLERRVVTFEDTPLADSPCTRCGLCVEACPVGALYFLPKEKARKEAR